ncbi:hypothetical protein, partial [Pleomorphochaeta sp. DL1XJH-081]|uniref:hypothetical protein n=1 Tax=Pleomorphochaeta sp. DL1XJH-081 TaxID=3409690 RepID=UPI003BB4E0F4
SMEGAPGPTTTVAHSIMRRLRARRSRCAKCSAAPCMTQAVVRPDEYLASVRHPHQPLTWRRGTAGW